MDTIKDFFAELKDRASNPLITSFVISWLFVNWPITIGLLFYTQKDLKLDGIKSYYNLILSYSNLYYNLLIPLGFALFYTLAFPYIRAWIKLLHAKISSKNESDILDATKGGYMPVAKYIKDKNKLTETIEQLTDLIDGESHLTIENAELKVKTEKLEADIVIASNKVEKVEERNTDLARISHESHLYGFWQLLLTQMNGYTVIQTWEVGQGNITMNFKYSHKIVNYVMNPISQEVILRILDNRSNQVTNYYLLYDKSTDSFQNKNTDGYSEIRLIRDQLNDSNTPPSRYLVEGCVKENIPIADVKTRFFEYLKLNEMREYSGVFDDNGDFNLQILFYKPSHYVGFMKELVKDRQIELKSYTGFGGFSQ